jgi:(1->4)-alpha-D-glucan 1-alpha-D-glucosylmutase
MRTPTSTYRVQFHSGFQFRDALAIVPYLDRLGVDALYASPIFKAKSGSSSGYDVTDPLQLNPELGSSEDFQALVGELQRREMGLLLDIVPNHMAAHFENPWWCDVLENGPSSLYAEYFDITWDPGTREREERLLRPVLGAPFGTVLENQELILRFDQRGFTVSYYDRTFPLDPKSYNLILRYGQDDPTRHDLGLTGFQELGRIEDLLDALPPYTTTDPDQMEQRQRDQASLRRRLWHLYESNAEFRAVLEETLAVFNGVKGDSRSFDLVEELLARQPYALSYWRVAREKINYRRFFDIADLVGLHVEDPRVFAATHALVFQLADEGKITGLRIDHIDGLYDPADYLRRLHGRLPETYIVVEKILHEGEDLDAAWPVQGTTGYDFLNIVNAVYTDSGGLDVLGGVYARVTGLTGSFADTLYEQKRRVVEQLFAGEALSLGLQLGLLADHDRHARDLSPSELQRALIEVTVCLDVYRTYVRTMEISIADRIHLEDALREAAKRNPAIDPAVFAFLRRLLLLEFPPSLPPDQRQKWLLFIRRWQQFTGPVTAKGLEDTTFYIHHRLLSLNEVGGPRLPLSLEEFHVLQQSRQEFWPHTMNVTSTHDTKRSEDVRARLTVLAEMPDTWGTHLSRWRNLNARAKPVVNGRPAPDSNEEVLIYQTLIGAWPLCPEEEPDFCGRLKMFLQKALREAKVHTSWMSPNAVYEDAVARFVDSILERSDTNRFLGDFLLFQRRIAPYGAFTSLSQTLVRLTSPGIPDTYQGTELWDLSLVDPDNRRPVDFGLRAEIQSAAEERSLTDLLEHWQDGGVKLFTIQKVLAFRQEHPDVFLYGDYLPLTALGPRDQHVIAFARRARGAWAVTVAPRFIARLSPSGNPPLGRRPWRGTTLRFPPSAPVRWTNVLTGEILQLNEDQELPLGAVLLRFPAAVLYGVAEAASEELQTGAEVSDEAAEALAS